MKANKEVPEEVLARLRDKMRKQFEWIGEKCPAILIDQNHLVSGSEARDYWHYGYAMCLMDTLNLIGDVPPEGWNAEWRERA